MKLEEVSTECPQVQWNPQVQPKSRKTPPEFTMTCGVIQGLVSVDRSPI